MWYRCLCFEGKNAIMCSQVIRSTHYYSPLAISMFDCGRCWGFEIGDWTDSAAVEHETEQLRPVGFDGLARHWTS